MEENIWVFGIHILQHNTQTAYGIDEESNCTRRKYPLTVVPTSKSCTTKKLYKQTSIKEFSGMCVCVCVTRAEVAWACIFVVAIVVWLIIPLTFIVVLEDTSFF